MKVEPEALAELNHHLPTVQRESPSAQYRKLSGHGTQFLDKNGAFIPSGIGLQTKASELRLAPRAQVDGG